MHRRLPPPNGAYSNGDEFLPKNRAGLKRSGYVTVLAAQVTFVVRHLPCRSLDSSD
jgi:hypothetical protein